MKLNRGIVLSILAAAAWLLAACSGVVVDDQTPLDGSSWYLVSMADANMEELEEPVTLQLENGTANGVSGCNQYSGDYVTVPETGEIIFSDVASTVMACEDDFVMEMEAQYLGALNAADSYEVDGDQLIINYSGEQLVFASNTDQ